MCKIAYKTMSKIRKKLPFEKNSIQFFRQNFYSKNFQFMELTVKKY